MADLEELILKAQKGDKQAFEKIYELYYERIYRYCKFNVYSTEIAQDICQETFLKAWRSFRSFSLKKGGTLQAYLFRIARNLIIDLSRKKKVYSLHEHTEIEVHDNVEETLEREQAQQKVITALSHLEEKDRQIIILRFFEEMESREIAAVIGIKEGALRVRMHRVLKKLKDLLET